VHVVFTGIVAAVGRIERIEPLQGGGQGAPTTAASSAPSSDAAGMRLWIDAGALDLSDVALGDSIAIQGACMTAVAIDGNRFAVDVSRESLSRTVGLDMPGEVNLEKALRLSDRLGGHLVSGHVDGLADVEAFVQVGESWRLDLRVGPELAKYFAYKGSVTVDGVSLTVNRVEDRDDGTVLSINLIPHTLQATTLKRLAAGRRVNVEVDLVARYLERMLQDRRPPRC
jgi:riboflavin synthase